MRTPAPTPGLTARTVRGFAWAFTGSVGQAVLCPPDHRDVDGAVVQVVDGEGLGPQLPEAEADGHRDQEEGGPLRAEEAPQEAAST